MKESIEKKLLDQKEEISKELIFLRRKFHQCPEVAWTEFKTTAEIILYFKQWGIPYRLGKDLMSESFCYGRDKKKIEEAKKRMATENVPKEILEEIGDITGVAAMIHTGKVGSTVVLRFDMDGLALSSGNRHACGHDGHIAMGLVLTRFLWENRASLNGEFRILFQPAEEGVRGGNAFAKGGILNNADYFLSGHLGMGNQTGEIVVGTDGFLATTKLDVTFYGKASHAGAAPEQGNNAVLAACNSVLSMQGFCQDGRGISRLNVGEIIGGKSRNIVPDQAVIRLETRGENTEIEQELYKKVLNCVQNSANIYGCRCETIVVGGAPSAQSSKIFAGEIYQVLRKHRFWERAKENVKFYQQKKFTGSEDVTYYINEIQKQKGKALYLGIGADICAAHHSEQFDFDESAMRIGVFVYLLILEQIMYY